jgi:hypothetical protein
MPGRAGPEGIDLFCHIAGFGDQGFDPAPQRRWRTPRSGRADCMGMQAFKIFDFSKNRSIVFGEIVSMYFRDDLINEETLRVNVDRFAPIGRLGGPNYCRSTDRVRLPVPTFLPSSGKPRV